MDNQSKEKINVGRLAVDIVVWIIVIFAALTTLSVFSSQANGGVPSLFGKMPITVQSNSMHPVLEAGDLIIAKKVKDVSTLKKDDIITFWTVIEGKHVKNTHRIFSVNEDGSFVTRGDNTTQNDSRDVLPGDVIGIYTKTKFGGIGKVFDFLQSQLGFMLVVVLPLLLFFLYQVYRFITVIVSMKKPKLSLEEEEELKKKAVEEYLKQQELSNEKEPQPADKE